jgi:hypothetical protein
MPLLPIAGESITIKGTLSEYGAEHFKKLWGTCNCDPFWTFHSKDCPSWPGVSMETVKIKEASAEFMEKIGLTPTPDAVDQMALVFTKCLEIMCRRGWDPNGGTWRRAGILAILCDIRKKFERLWERGWVNGKRHPDSCYDLINYVGMYMRSDEDNGWGEWGEPAARSDIHEDRM